MNTGVPVLVAGNLILRCAHFRADGSTSGTSRLNGHGVLDCQAVPRCPSRRARRRWSEIAGKDEHHIFAQAGDLILDLLLGAVGDADRAR